jgi:dienelactone hydrolase
VVVMPDLFNGDPAPNASAIEEQKESLLDQFKLRAFETVKSFMIDMWLARHTEEKVMPILHKVVDGCKEKFGDAVKNGDGIYAVGYCIGGRYVLRLASESQHISPAESASSEIKTGPLIKVGALAHGASVIPSDFSDLKVPISLVCVENDPLFPDEVRVTGEEAMSKAGLEHEVQVYPGVPHGQSIPNFPHAGPIIC